MYSVGKLKIFTNIFQYFKNFVNYLKINSNFFFKVFENAEKSDKSDRTFMNEVFYFCSLLNFSSCFF